MSPKASAVKEGPDDASSTARPEHVPAGDEPKTGDLALRDAGLAIARWWLKARRLREEMFGPGLFADPAWDILLDLYSAAARGESVPTSSLAHAARVPHSTAIRWAKLLTKAGIVVREKDPRDARRVLVSLSAAATALMEGYLARLSRDGAVPAGIVSQASA
jgi:DNA-binding MarR family transcriptional regulator